MHPCGWRACTTPRLRSRLFLAAPVAALPIPFEPAATRRVPCRESVTLASTYWFSTLLQQGLWVWSRTALCFSSARLGGQQEALTALLISYSRCASAGHHAEHLAHAAPAAPGTAGEPGTWCNPWATALPAARAPGSPSAPKPTIIYALAQAGARATARAAALVPGAVISGTRQASTVPLSRFEPNDTLDEAYSKIEKRLAVSTEGSGPGLRPDTSHRPPRVISLAARPVNVLAPVHMRRRSSASA